MIKDFIGKEGHFSGGIGKWILGVYGILWCSDENITYNNYLPVRLTVELTITLSDVTMNLPVR